ncbi:hypothetical protein D3C81_743360 [compost metagenome]
MPMMAFIGVRISWLMVARKLLLARVASSAASRARCTSASAVLRSVMSKYQLAPMPRSPSVIVTAETSTSKRSPPARCRVVSKFSTAPCAAASRKRWCACGSTQNCAGSVPSSSARRVPNKLSNCGLQ